MQVCTTTRNCECEYRRTRMLPWSGDTLNDHAPASCVLTDTCELCAHLTASCALFTYRELYAHPTASCVLIPPRAVCHCHCSSHRELYAHPTASCMLRVIHLRAVCSSSLRRLCELPPCVLNKQSSGTVFRIVPTLSGATDTLNDLNLGVFWA